VCRRRGRRSGGDLATPCFIYTWLAGRRENNSAHHRHRQLERVRVRVRYRWAWARAHIVRANRTATILLFTICCLHFARPRGPWRGRYRQKNIRTFGILKSKTKRKKLHDPENRVRCGRFKILLFIIFVQYDVAAAALAAT